MVGALPDSLAGSLVYSPIGVLLRASVPVTDAHYPHFMGSVIHCVDDTMVADSDEPIFVGADNLASSGGPRVVGQTFEVKDYATEQMRVKAAQVALGSALG